MCACPHHCPHARVMHTRMVGCISTQIHTHTQVERWGMSDKLGVVSHANLTGTSDSMMISEETRAAIDSEVL